MRKLLWKSQNKQKRSLILVGFFVVLMPVTIQKKSKAPLVQERQEKEKQGSLLAFLFSLFLLLAVVLTFKDCVLDANNIPSGSMLPTLKIGDYLFVNKMRYSVRLPFIAKELFVIDDPQRGDIITFLPPQEKQKHYVKRVMAMPLDRIRIREIRGCDLRPKAGHSAGQKKRKDDENKQIFFCKKQYRDINEPIISRIEYREKDSGPWKSYPLEELPKAAAYREFLDSDNEDILPPEIRSSIDHYYPLLGHSLYRETVNGQRHLIIESALSVESSHLCPEIYSSGCIVPADHYMVMGDNRDYSKDSRIIGFIPRARIYGKVLFIYFSINWRDDICGAYWARYREGKSLVNQKQGFHLEDFNAQEQFSLCTQYDFYQKGQGNSSSRPAARIGDYLYHTLRYRLPRMSVRWSRVGTLLQ